MRAAGLPTMRFHDLRHAYATLLISTGVHPRVLMELMGHSTITVTMNIYGHVGAEVASAATDLLSAAMNDAMVTQSSDADEPVAAGAVGKP
jgi:integrase